MPFGMIQDGKPSATMESNTVMQYTVSYTGVVLEVKCPHFHCE